MEADSDPVSDNRTDNHEPGRAPDMEEPGSVPFDRMVWPRPAPDIDPENLPEIPPHQQVWWYDQPANTKRGKHRRYTGYVKRVGGTEGERIRRELAAIIYDLLDWAKQQADTPETETRSEKDGEADGNPE